MSLNITEVRLLNVPLENDYQHTLYFDSKEAQAEYFLSRTYYEFKDFSYQRKEGFIRIPAFDKNNVACIYDSLITSGVNYIMFKNTAYTNKWFYGFITDMKYINDDRTDIYFEIDVMQTFAFNYQIKPSFIEREHVSDDYYGKHTQPENLETGEYIINDKHTFDMGNLCIVIATTYYNGQNVQGGVYGNSYSGVKYIATKISNYQKVNEWIASMTSGNGTDSSEGGKVEAIQCIFIAPQFVLGDIDTNNLVEVNGTIFQPQNTEGFTFPMKVTDINGYTPKNNKLFSYPFRYILMDNNNGGSAIYNYEHFRDGVAEDEGINRLAPYIMFTVCGVVTPGCSIKLMPQFYKGSFGGNLQESLNAGKFPICNWNSDVYTNWLTQNAVNIGISLVEGGIKTVGGFGLAPFTGGTTALVGAMGIKEIATTLAQVHTQSFVPPQSNGNLNSGDILTAMEDNTFTAYEMSIKSEYAKIIDEYFSMYGYKINRVKYPNRLHRKEYWYTKTIGINIDGNMEHQYIQKIKDIYNNGITFWKNPENFQNYNVDNPIEITENSVCDKE